MISNANSILCNEICVEMVRPATSALGQSSGRAGQNSAQVCCFHRPTFSAEPREFFLLCPGILQLAG